MMRNVIKTRRVYAGQVLAYMLCGSLCLLMSWVIVETQLAPVPALALVHG